MTLNLTRACLAAAALVCLGGAASAHEPAPEAERTLQVLVSAPHDADSDGQDGSVSPFERVPASPPAPAKVLGEKLDSGLGELPRYGEPGNRPEDWIRGTQD